MRPLILPAVALLLLATSAPALASAGLPKIATLHVGEHIAAIHNDSSSVKTGANVFTIEIAGLPVEHHVHFKLVGPGGEVVEVPLQRLVVLKGPDEGHEMSEHDMSAMSMDHSAPATDHSAPATDHSAMSMDHSAMSMGHGTTAPAPAPAPSHQHDSGSTPAAAAPDTHAAAPAGESFSARGKAVLGVPGTWRAVMEIDGDHAGPMTGETAVEVRAGGPAPLYLGFTGLTMGGFLSYGIIRRRPQQRSGR